ncbi:MAG TPA: sulfite exporter TauE/SafE family protein [Clostridiales bacterium]|nr:sulfite exporter TauE/SafE family protein [Clostridiales bacterium]
MSAILVFQILVIIMAAIFTAYLLIDIFQHKESLKGKHWLNLSLAGIITQFFDTLGIGSYGPLSAWFKIGKAVPDKLIPGTLNTCTVVTCAIMTIAYTTTIDVEIPTLIVPVVCSTIGAFLGAGLVSKLPVKQIRLGLGFALIIVAITIMAGLLGWMPGGGEEIGLSAGKLVVLGILAFILGALMTIGIGIYAPMMAIVYLMGLSPYVAFPLMMGSCAFLIPAAGIRFIKESRKRNTDTYDRKAGITVNFIGIIGVLVAVFIVKSIPLTVLKWLVICVLIYTAIMLIRDAFMQSKVDVKEVKSETDPTVITE